MMPEALRESAAPQILSLSDQLDQMRSDGRIDQRELSGISSRFEQEKSTLTESTRESLSVFMQETLREIVREMDIENVDQAKMLLRIVDGSQWVLHFDVRAREAIDGYIAVDGGNPENNGNPKLEVVLQEETGEVRLEGLFDGWFRRENRSYTLSEGEAPQIVTHQEAAAARIVTPESIIVNDQEAQDQALNDRAESCRREFNIPPEFVTSTVDEFCQHYGDLANYYISNPGYIFINPDKLSSMGPAAYVMSPDWQEPMILPGDRDFAFTMSGRAEDARIAQRNIQRGVQYASL